MLTRLIAAISLVASLAISLNLQAATIDIDASVATGVTNIDANNTHYSVQFLSGSCNSLYAPCETADDFPFDRDGALAAVTELGNLLAAGIADFPGWPVARTIVFATS